MNDYIKAMKLINNEQAIVIQYYHEEEPEQTYQYDYGDEGKEG